MKKICAVLLILVLLFNGSPVFAASCFTNNAALDAAFAQLEKAFMASEQQNYTLEITRGGKTDFKAKMLPKMTNAMIKAAVTEVLNDIRFQIELKEEELGGLTKEDYKNISTQLINGIKINKGFFQYEEDQKSVVLSFGIGGREFERFDNLKGNFAGMGSEKDEVCPADLEVKNKVARYIEQSKQKGKKFSPEIANNLPDSVDRLFKELQPSKIVAAQAISRIHLDIYDEYATQYDGSESLESIIEDCRSMFEMLQGTREDEKKVEDHTFQNDAPSSQARDYIAELITDGKLSEYFNSGFNKAITLDELARLYFESKELDEKIVLEDGTIKPNAPDYIKNAFIYGMIDGDSDLNKPLNRLEAARYLINGIVYQGSGGVSTALRFVDCAKIPADDLVTVSNCFSSGNGMSLIGMNFEPQGMYTKQDAIMDKWKFDFYYIRGYDAPISLRDPSRIIIGKSTVHLQFEDKEQVEEYIADVFEDSAIGNIKRNGSYMRIDTGCALLEFFTPENGIKFTFKNGVKYINFDDEVYGPELQYKIEPRALSSGEKVDMNMQVDSIHKKIYTKLDAVLAKIIKPAMTAEQKAKAIHDYVVTHITYDSNYADEETAENLLKAIDKGRGVCGDYAMLFDYLCDRASIPCTFEGGDTNIGDHAWNAVFVNGQWKFVDTTWNDDKTNKVSYKYFLVDKFTFLKDHTALMGVPDASKCPEVDGMNIKSQDELRVYLLKKFYWIDGFKVTFRMTDKKMKPNIGYLWSTREVKVVLTYDSKQDLYTVAAKAR